MFSAADLIDAVQRKLRLTHRRSHPPGEFPPGWSRWFDAMRSERGSLNGAPAEAMVAALLAREPAVLPAGPFADLTRWQAFTAVWRQDWSSRPADDGRMRLASGLLSLLLNFLFAAMFLWLLFAPPRLGPPAAEGEEVVVQVEFIGDGTPDETGGGPETAVVEPTPTLTPAPERPEAREPSSPDAPAPEPREPVAQSTPPVPEIVVSTTPPELSAPATKVVEREVPTPQPPTPATEQRVMVSEPAPDTTDAVFLPPPTPVVAIPALSAPELVSEQPSVLARDVPVPEVAPTAPTLDIPASDTVATPQLRSDVAEVQARDIPAPVVRPDLSPPPAPAIAAPTLDAAEPAALRERSIPLPAASTPAASTTEPAQASATTPAASSESSAATPSTASSAESSAPVTPPAPASGGPRPAPAPGGWPTPERSDDFGASDRNVPGGQRGDDGPGLYNADGSIRLADTPGTASPGQPPGTYTEEIAHLDRNGTWLKRPPVGYEPTLFDRYWRPNENLLQEWVRRGIKTVSIPIPGTSKKVQCAVSLLALGGGCGISDPNLNEQPASARPPPDIPFKPELQDDNGSIRPEAGG